MRFTRVAEISPTATFVGTTGTDTIVGTTGNDSIDGQAGDDSIEGRAGDDSVLGGAGDSFIHNASIIINELQSGTGARIPYFW